MGLMNDNWIREQAKAGMIEPFVESLASEGVISYGVSSYGYDARVADDFKVFTNVDSAIVDPKNFSPKCLVDKKGEYCIIPPNSFALARTVEYFRIPSDVLVICLGKSTYARCGIIVNVTPLEPGWEGHVTLEFSNTTPLPAKIYANEGACQFLFFKGDEPCSVTYADRKGKYQKQTGVTLPKIKNDKDNNSIVSAIYGIKAAIATRQEKKKLLEDNDWYPYYHDDYWCHPSLAGEYNDCTHHGMSLENAYKHCVMTIKNDIEKMRRSIPGWQLV